MFNHELTHKFQPIVDMLTLELLRHEALLRIDGIDDIEEFTRCVEASGDIIKLDLITLESVIRHLAINDVRSKLPVAINVSPISLASREFQAKAIEMLRQRPSPLDVSVEITEASPITEMAGTKEFIQKLKRLGCTVGMDDYGDGFARLELVDELQLDYLKLSGRLTQDVLTTDSAMNHVIEAIEFARSRGVFVVAEHIDNIPQYHAFRNLGVEQGQGWLFAKADELIEEPEQFQKSLRLRINDGGGA